MKRSVEDVLIEPQEQVFDHKDTDLIIRLGACHRSLALIRKPWTPLEKMLVEEFNCR